MKPGFYTFSFLLCTSLSLLFAPPLTAQDKIDPPAAADASFNTGEVIRYEGKTQIAQKVGDGQAQADSFNCTLLTISEGPLYGARTLLAVRELIPAGEGGSPEATHQILDLDKGYIPKARETAIELETPHQRIGIYLPMRLGMPPAKTPPRHHEVLILNQIPVQIEYTHSTTSGSNFRTQSIGNAKKTTFDFRGSEATLNKWEESYTSDKKQGVITGYRFDYEFSVTINGNDITLSLNCALEAKEITTLAKAPALAKGLAAFRTASAAFADMKPSTETRPLVEEVGKLLDKSPWSALARAARTQHQGFVETFESDDAGKVLAKIIGKPAPDFTLNDLDGKQVNFRKETAGKVTLLSFWGYG
jgi:hypothetical protein